MALDAMREANADECVLETELTNKGALRLYENLGFVRHKRYGTHALQATAPLFSGGPLTTPLALSMLPMKRTGCRSTTSTGWMHSG